MRLFVDTEFTDFLNCDLVSIGIVSQDGREFYAERTDYDESACSAFVREVVLPKLGHMPAIVGTEAEISAALRQWLAQFEAVNVCFDYQADWEFFLELARDEDYKMPLPVTGQNIKADLNPRAIEQYWKENGRQAHHALHDARANKYAFQCSKAQSKSDIFPVSLTFSSLVRLRTIEGLV